MDAVNNRITKDDSRMILKNFMVAGFRKRSGRC
jgi:hypothetical protein